MCDKSAMSAVARSNGIGERGATQPLSEVPDPDERVGQSARPEWADDEPGRVRLIAVPCERGVDLDVERSVHFGRAPAFALVRLEGEEIAGWWVIDNKGHDHSHGLIAITLAEEGVTEVVTAGIGVGMYQRLTSLGVRVWLEQDAATVTAAIQALLDGKAIPVAEGDLGDEHTM